MSIANDNKIKELMERMSVLESRVTDLEKTSKRLLEQASEPGPALLRRTREQKTWKKPNSLI